MPPPTILFPPPFSLHCWGSRRRLTLPPFTLSPPLVFPVLLFPRRATPLFSFPARVLRRCAALCLPVLLHSRWRRGEQRRYIRGKPIWVTHVWRQQQRTVGADGCQRAFSRGHVRAGVHVSGDAARPPFSPLYIVSKLLSTAASFVPHLFIYLFFLPVPFLRLLRFSHAGLASFSLAHCCVTVSHHRSPERVGREPTSRGGAGCLCLFGEHGRGLHVCQPTL